MTSINYKNYNTSQSIVNQQDAVEITGAQDKNEPFTFLQWANLSSISDKNSDVAKQLYNKYLTEWSAIKSGDLNKSTQSVTEMFSNFLKQLPADTTEDESRYINNIDYSDKYEVESAIKFFVSKLKKVSNEIGNNRQSVAFQTTRNSIRGTKSGSALLIKDMLIRVLRDEDFISDKIISPADKQKIIDQIQVTVTELYDSKTTGTDNTENDTNIVNQKVEQKIEYDPYIFIDTEIATVNLLDSYGTILSDTVSTVTTNNQNEIALNFTPDLNTVQNLPSSEFVDYNKTTLNIDSMIKIVPQLMSSRVDYVNTSTLSAVETGELFDSRKNLNRLSSTLHPSIDIFENTSVNRVTTVGNFYTPAKLGLLKYYSFDFTPEILNEHLEKDKIYTHTNLSDSGSNFNKIPVDYYEDFTMVKNSTVESGRPGEISHDLLKIPRFHNYQSREQTNVFSQEGVSRKDDSFDFWTGDVDDVWANQDVFELEAENIFNIDDRQQTMFANVGHMYKWKTDAHGNEFGVLKKIAPFPGLTLEDLKDPDPTSGCYIMDGDLFKDGSTREITTYEYTVNESSGNLFTNLPFSRVANGMFFSRVDCVFEEPEPETLVIDIPKLRGGQLYCIWLDGFVMRFNGLYELTSTNNDNNFAADPSISKIWDGLDFNQVCIAAPRTDEFYKLETTRVHIDGSDQYVHTQVENLDDFESLNLEDQQITPGNLVVRTADSGKIGNFNTICDKIINKYSSNAQHEINNELLDIDIISGDIIIFETTNYYIIDRITYDYTNNEIISEETPAEIHKHSDEYEEYVISDWFFNESKNQILFSVLRTVRDSITRDSRIETVLYWINTTNFTLQKSSPVIDWYNTQEIVSKSIHNLQKPKITYNSELDKYYIICTCNYSQIVDGPKSFAIFVCGIKSKGATNVTTATTYTATRLAIETGANRTEQEQQVNDSESLILTETSSRTIDGSKYYGVVEYKNSLYNTLELDISRLAPSEFATRVEVMFDEEDDKTTQTNTHRPIITYDNFDNLVGNNTRDPRNYKLQHVYTNNKPRIVCKVQLYTLTEPSRPRVYKVLVEQKPTDITSSFGKIVGAGDVRLRSPQGVQISHVTVINERTGGENLLLVLKTTSPDYTTTVLLKLAEPIRQTITYTATDKTIMTGKSIDDVRLRIKYDSFETNESVIESTESESTEIVVDETYQPTQQPQTSNPVTPTEPVYQPDPVSQPVYYPYSK